MHPGLHAIAAIAGAQGCSKLDSRALLGSPLPHTARRGGCPRAANKATMPIDYSKFDKIGEDPPPPELVLASQIGVPSGSQAYTYPEL